MYYTHISIRKGGYMYMDQEGTTLAMEILAEVQRSAKRWFIAFIIMTVLEAATIAGFVWYISLPIEESVTVENDEGNANYIGGDVGGDVNNGKDNR